SAGFAFNFDVATGVFLVRDVYGSLHVNDDLVVVDVGQMKAPFLLTEMVSEAKLQFPTQPLGVKRMGYGRDRGVRVRGELAPSGVYIGWAGAVQNGEGATVTSNADSEFLYSGRLEVGPLGEVPLAEPDLQDSDFGFVLGGSVGHTQSTARKDLGIDDVGAEETRMEGDIRIRFRGISLRAEYMRAQVDRKDTGVSFGRYGFTTQAGYVLPLPFETKFEVVGRLEQFDLNDEQDGMVAVGGGDGTTDPESLTGGSAGFEYAVPDNSELRRIEFGANMYVVEHRLKLQASYVLTAYQEGPKTEGGGNPIVGDLVQVQLQFGWM
ncbi:MAG: porin, partial [Myxococcota bacterium]